MYSELKSMYNTFFNKVVAIVLVIFNMNLHAKEHLKNYICWTEEDGYIIRS